MTLVFRGERKRLTGGFSCHYCLIWQIKRIFRFKRIKMELFLEVFLRSETSFYATEMEYDIVKFPRNRQ